MKTAVIFLTDINSPEFSLRLKGLEEVLSANGIEKQMLACIPFDLDIEFNSTLKNFKDLCDNVIIFGVDKALFDYKSVISDLYDCQFIENENALNILSEVCESRGISVDSSNASIPELATVIPNKIGLFQGFLLEDEYGSLALFPYDLEQAKIMVKSYYAPYFANTHGVKSSVVLKYFGERDILEKTLNDIIKQTQAKLRYTILDNNLDVCVRLNFESGIEKYVEAEVLRRVQERLGEALYADFDVSLEQRLFDLLKLKNLQLSVAESFTAGRIVSGMIKIPGASSVVHEGIVSYSNLSKIKRLGVVKEDIESLGAVSSKVAYEMALGLLKEGNCQLAISSTGIAGPKSDDSLKPVGLCYLAVGMQNGVHVYKRQFAGNREEITEKAKNTALFLAINMLNKL